MKLAEFQERAERYHKRQLVTLVPMIGTLVLCSVWAAAAPRFDPWFRRVFPELVVPFARVVPMAVLVILGIGSIIPLTRRLEAREGVACPHCGKAVADFRGIVIASKCCPFCGRKVIDDGV